MAQNLTGENLKNGHLENFDENFDEFHNVNAHIY